MILVNIVPAQNDKNARGISGSKSLRGVLFKTRRRQLVLVLLYINKTRKHETQQVKGNTFINITSSLLQYMSLLLVYS